MKKAFERIANVSNELKPVQDNIIRWTNNLNSDVYERIRYVDFTGNDLVRVDAVKQVYPASKSTDWWLKTGMSATGQYAAVVSGGLGGSGNVYITSNYGRDWKVVYPRLSTPYDGCAMSRNGAVVMAGGYSGRLWISLDYGATWTERQPAGAVDADWKCLAADEDGSFLIAGAYGARLYTSSDYGVNWTARTLAGVTNGNWNYSAIDGTGKNLMATDYTNRCYVSNDGGANWTAQTCGGVTTGNWFGCAVARNDNTYYVVNRGGLAYKTIDNGTNWTAISPGGATTANWRTINCSLDGQVVLITADNGPHYMSRDQGATWTTYVRDNLTTSSNSSMDWYGTHAMIFDYEGAAFIYPASSKLTIAHKTADIRFVDVQFTSGVCEWYVSDKTAETITITFDSRNCAGTVRLERSFDGE